MHSNQFFSLSIMHVLVHQFGLRHEKSIFRNHFICLFITFNLKWSMTWISVETIDLPKNPNLLIMGGGYSCETFKSTSKVLPKVYITLTTWAKGKLFFLIDIKWSLIFLVSTHKRRRTGCQAPPMCTCELALRYTTAGAYGDFLTVMLMNLQHPSLPPTLLSIAYCISKIQIKLKLINGLFHINITYL